jgi:hypothetical protein
MSGNIFGNLTGDPSSTVEEKRGEHFIKIFIYENGGGYVYGYQVKVGKLIRQKVANIADERFATRERARISAVSEIETLRAAMNATSRNIFADFSIIRHNQPELF